MLGSRHLASPLLLMVLCGLCAAPAEARVHHRAHVSHTAHRPTKARAPKAQPKAEKSTPRGDKEIAPRPGDEAAIKASPFALIPGTMEGAFPYAATNELGARWVQEPVALSWGAVQRDPARISYDFAPFDRLMAAAPQGLPLIWTLSVAAPDALAKGSAFTAAKSYVPLKPEMYTLFVRTVVSRYGKGWGGSWAPVHYWQIEEAPSPAKGDHYVDTALMTVEAIKTVDPSAKIVLGLSVQAAPEAEAIKALDEAAKAYFKSLKDQGADVVNLRWEAKAPGDIHAFAPVLAHLKQIMTEAGLGADTPLWATLTSPTGEPANALTEAQRAADLVQRHVVALQLGVPRLFWSGALLGPDRLPRPSYFAYKLMTEKLEGTQLPPRVVWSEDKGLQAYGFVRPDGKETLVVWSDDDKPSWTALPYPGLQARVIEAVPDDKGNIRNETVKVEDARLLVDLSKGPVYIEPVAVP